MNPRVYRATVHTTLVITAYDEAEATAVAKKFAFVDGASQRFDKPSDVVTLDHLPSGWTGGELAFSKTDHELYGQRPIKHWLPK